MNSRPALIAVGGLLILGMGAWIVRLQAHVADLEAQLAEAPEVSVSAASIPGNPERPRHIRARDHAAPRGSGAQLPQRGGSDEEPTQPGEGDAAEDRPERDWEAMRAEMQANTIETVEAFGTQSGWSPETTDEVVTVLLDTGDAIGEVWAMVREGELTHYKARKEMHTLHEEAGQDIVALIGEESYEVLEEQLFEARHEAWRRSGDGEHRRH